MPHPAHDLSSSSMPHRSAGDYFAGVAEPEPAAGGGAAEPSEGAVEPAAGVADPEPAEPEPVA